MSLQGYKSQPNLPQFWNIAHPKNLFFTGREEVLAELRTTLENGHVPVSTRPLAICGLGGIGKTQIVLEYVYSSLSFYHAILWVRADSRTEIISSYMTIAALLDLPQKNEKDENQVIAAVMNWLQTQKKWLLIFDNGDDPSIVEEFIPLIFGGHILLTTRSSILGPLARSIEVKTMTPEVGAFFLLRRAKRISLNASLENAALNDRAVAMEIVQELDGLPLAIDQAGAYLEETRCSLSDYLGLSRKERFKLLQRRGRYSDHPEPVMTTWSMSFQRLDPPSAELLRLCTFLYPDTIPEKIITQGASHLGAQLQTLAEDQFAFDKAVNTLLAYSLIDRDEGSNTLSIHRLVQTALQNEMDQKTFQLWVERVINTVNELFPSYIDFTTWHRCEQLVSHAQTCIMHMEQVGIKTHGAARLLNKTGIYLHERGRYTEAESYLQHALAIQEELSGFEHEDTAWMKLNLAMLYYEMGRYSAAKSLLLQALAIQEKLLEPNSPIIAMSKTQLAWVHQAQGEYEDAEILYAQALKIRQQSLVPEHIDTATSMTNLAWIYYTQGKYKEAEPLYLQALAIHQERVGIEHPLTARDQNNLALLYMVQGKYAEAENLLLQAIAIRERWMGPEHTAVAVSIGNLAQLYHLQGEFVKAEHLYKQAFKIQRQRLGVDHPDTARTMGKLGSLHCSQGRLVEAEPLLLQSLAIQRQQLGIQNIRVAKNMVNLANLYMVKGMFAEAEELFQQALQIYEKRVLSVQYDRIGSLKDYAHFLRMMNRNAEAQVIEEQIPYKE